MSILVVVGIIVGLAIEVILVMAAIAMINTHKLLRDVIDSGAIPQVTVFRAKRQAIEIVNAGVITDPKIVEQVMEVLSPLKSDRQAMDLVSKLNDLQKKYASQPSAN
jgi:hypothetical protein